MGTFFLENWFPTVKMVPKRTPGKKRNSLKSRTDRRSEARPKKMSVFFHAGDRGSNPLGDANNIK